MSAFVRSRADALLREIIDHVSIVLGAPDVQTPRIARLVAMGTEVVPAIEAAVESVGRWGDHHAQFDNAALLCDAIARAGGPHAADALSRIAAFPSSAAEYGRVRDAAARALERLGSARDQTPSRIEEARSCLPTLTITGEEAAVAELDAQNAARRTVWREQAAVIPIVRGSAATAFAAVEACIAADFAERGARELELEKVEETWAAGVRKVVLTTYFANSFGRHEIVRIGEDEYASMPCTLAPVLPREARRSEPPVARAAGWRSSKALRIALGIFAVWITIGGIVAIVRALAPLGRSSRPSVDAGALAALAAVRTVVVAGDGAPVRAAVVQPRFFDAARVQPQVGRLLLPGDFDGLRAAVVSDSFWNRRLRRNPAVVGTDIVIDDRRMTIVGVAPPGFAEPGGVDIWLSRGD